MAYDKNARHALLGVFAMNISDKFRKYGYGWLLSRISRRATVELAWLLLLPFALVLHLLGYRRLGVHGEHIGHLAADIDTFMKEKELGLLPHRRWFLLGPGLKIANQHILANEHLFAYWQGRIPTVTGPVACAILDLMTRRGLARHDLSHYIAAIFGTQQIYRINRLWSDRPPILELNEEDERFAATALPELGIPSGRWFACVHVREGGFLPGNELVQSHRNASILATIPALKEIVRRGGLCVRMGDPSMTPLPSIEGVIDYARHASRSARLDIILCAKARFFLGCTSGLSFVSVAFGVPVAHANMTPMSTLGVRHCDISIPKLIWSNPRSTHLRFEEIFRSEIGGYYFTHEYERAELRVDENSSDEILELTEEMLDRLDGRFVASPEEDDRQRTYLSLLRPGSYSYGTGSSICHAFLRRHADLLS
jgi:putative glycosyltransferase (TIGR04372 family)